MSNPILSWRRVRALCVKETRQIVRDPSSWLIAVVIPLLLLFIFGYGINLDSSKLRVGILLEQRSEAALDFTHTMTGSPYIDATISDNRQELIAKMQAGKIRGLVVIPVDFAVNRIPLTLYRGMSKGSGRSGKCSERRTTGRLLNRLLMYKPATGLTRRRLASTSLSPVR